MIRSFESQPNNTETHFQNWLLHLSSYPPSPLQKILYIFAIWWEEVLNPYLGANSQVTLHVLILNWCSLWGFFSLVEALLRHNYTLYQRCRPRCGGKWSCTLGLCLPCPVLSSPWDQHWLSRCHKLCSRWAKHREIHHRVEKLWEAWGSYFPENAHKHERAGR